MNAFWLFVIGAVELLGMRGRTLICIVRAPQVAAVVLLLVAGFLIITQPERTGAMVHDLFAGSGSGNESSSAPATDTPVSPAAEDSVAETPAWDCPEDRLCFWSGTEGTGSKCIWDAHDPDWRAGDIVCSWSEWDRARSVFNNSLAPAALVYFKRANYQGRIGCVEPGQQSNLPTSSGVRSHRLVYSSCAESA